MYKNNLEELIDSCLIRWNELRDILENSFRNREKDYTLTAMNEGISIFIDFLYYSNNKELDNENRDSFLQFECQPINLAERIQFIKDRPNHYLSFIQLCELMNEQEKHYKKNLALKQYLENK